MSVRLSWLVQQVSINWRSLWLLAGSGGDVYSRKLECCNLQLLPTNQMPTSWDDVDVWLPSLYLTLHDSLYTSYLTSLLNPLYFYPISIFFTLSLKLMKTCWGFWLVKLTHGSLRDRQFGNLGVGFVLTKFSLSWKRLNKTTTLRLYLLCKSWINALIENIWHTQYFKKDKVVP